MPLQNFIDSNLPTIKAAWLNAIDAFYFTLFNSSTTAAQARVALDVPSNAEAILDTLINAKGDLIIGTANDTPAVKSVGAPGTVLMARSIDVAGLAYVAALTKAIYGFTYANSTLGNPNQDLDIAAGGAMDATGAYWITTAALTKRTDVAWAVGDSGGGLDTGSVGNSDYYIWTIARSGTGVTDYLFSLSSTAPTMPTNYDFKRLIGWFKRAGGVVVLFTIYATEGGGIEFLWTVPTLDVNLANTLTTARRTDALRVPLNFSVEAYINVAINDATTASNAWIYCPDQTDAAPSPTAAPLANIFQPVGGGATAVLGMRIRTNASGQIAARSSLATVDLYAVSTMGFRWSRRN